MNKEEIISLIQSSQCLDNEEKWYWIDILDLMNESQKLRLKDILIIDNKKLQRLHKDILLTYWEWK